MRKLTMDELRTLCEIQNKYSDLRDQIAQAWDDGRRDEMLEYLRQFLNKPKANWECEKCAELELRIRDLERELQLKSDRLLTAEHLLRRKSEMHRVDAPAKAVNH